MWSIELPFLSHPLRKAKLLLTLHYEPKHKGGGGRRNSSKGTVNLGSGSQDGFVVILVDIQAHQTCLSATRFCSTVSTSDVCDKAFLASADALNIYV